MPRVWGQQSLEFSQCFPSCVEGKKTLLAHPINVLLARGQCKMVCAGAFQPAEDRRSVTNAIPAALQCMQHPKLPFLAMLPRSDMEMKLLPFKRKGRQALTTPSTHGSSFPPALPDPGNHLTLC